MEDVSQSELSKILLVAQTNNAVDVLEDTFLNGIPMYIQAESKWDTFLPIYHRILSHRPSGDDSEEPFTLFG